MHAMTLIANFQAWLLAQLVGHALPTASRPVMPDDEWIFRMLQNRTLALALESIVVSASPLAICPNG